MIAVLGAALAACHGAQQQNSNENIAIDDRVPANQVRANADIEALPADESSTTPSTELQNGSDDADVNSAATNTP